jgi:hypothetical protein
MEEMLTTFEFFYWNFVVNGNIKYNSLFINSKQTFSKTKKCDKKKKQKRESSKSGDAISFFLISPQCHLSFQNRRF